jgi:hypothetical protein
VTYFERVRWLDRFSGASLQFVAIEFVCLMAFAVIAIRRGKSPIGIVLIALGILCFPGLPLGVALGLVVGWIKCRPWQTRTFMVFWTALSVLAVLNFAGFFYFRFVLEKN